MKKLNPVYVLFVVLVLTTSCQKMEKADLIVKNASVYTVNADFSVQSSFAVKDGKFVAVGTDQEIEEQYRAGRVLDMKGKAVYPGFIDGHCHFYHYGVNKMRYADLTGTTSFDEILKILEKHHENNPAEWLLGRGWDQNEWSTQDFPTNQELNKRYPDTPVVLTRVDGHAVVANEEAITRAELAESDIPKDEAIYSDGELTGVFLEGTADRLRNQIPEPTRAEKVEALLTAQKDCFSAGLTSVMDAGLEKPVIDVIDSLQKAGELKMRVDAMLTPNKENIDAFVKEGPYKTDRLHIHSIKLYADGALGSRGACLLEPYDDDPGNYGLLVNKPQYYRDMLELAYNNDYQVNTHAIGDSAVRFLLNEYSKYLEPDNDRRWRIEHAQIVHPDDFDKFGKYNIIPSMQATHATSDMGWAPDRIGKKRMQGAYALEDLMQQNGWLVNGTDFPIERINPIYTFYASVVRKDLEGKPEEGFQMENALSRKNALRSITLWAAKGSFEEEEKGSIEPGKKADFVVLDRDIMKVNDERIPGAEVLHTFSAGIKVYEK
ncbi:MAG: amidohydrolase [Bacteroidales bacterium]|nr:amidohydrolase [Bacteroidales bacterium]MCF8336546.1 amidohydrolase [Bacteroidales bacterium]